MKQAWKWIAGLLALALLIFGAYVLYNHLSKGYAPNTLAPQPSVQPSEEISPDKDSAQQEEAEQQQDFTAPDFTVVDNNGNPVNLSGMKGKPVVINFWASWCPPCKAEMPDFEAMYQKYGETVTFMMVNMTDGQQETLESAKEHIAQSGYTFPVYFDTEYSAAYAYYVTSLPTTYFVDADGNLVTYANGMIDASLLETGIGMILE